MPLLPGNRTRIELPVSDRQFHDTLIRQKARFKKLEHDQDAAGVCRAFVTVVVTMYAADGDGFGPALAAGGFMPREEVLVADNRTVVDAQTGAILATRTVESDEQWQQHLAEYELPVMLQGDFFEFLRESQPILIGEMIRNHIQQADAMGRFA